MQDYAFSNLDRFESSSLVTRMTTDVTCSRTPSTAGFGPWCAGPVMLVMGLWLSFWMNARLALIFVVTAPHSGPDPVLCGAQGGAPWYSRLQKAMDKLNNVVQEGLTAIRAGEAFVRGEYEEEKFQTVNEELMATSQRTFHFAVLNLPAFQFTMYTAIVLILWFGGGMILDGGLQVGELTGFLSYVLQVMNSFMMISNVFLAAHTVLWPAPHRIAEVAGGETGPYLPGPAGGGGADGSVDFEGVSFKYHAEAKEIRPVRGGSAYPGGPDCGHPGGYRFRQDHPGPAHSPAERRHRRVVKVGGHDVKEYDLTSLRDAVGIVLQKNVLFSGTVRENLQWGDPSADDERLWDACRAAGADEFLERMPDAWIPIWGREASTSPAARSSGFVLPVLC